MNIAVLTVSLMYL